MKYYIKTYGCQMNRADSDNIEKVFLSYGFEPVDEFIDADIIHINTCCVRQKAEDKFFSLLGEIKKLKLVKKDLVIGVSGCIVENIDILEKAPFIDYAFGAKRSKEYASLIDSFIKEKYRNNLFRKIDVKQNSFSKYFTLVQGCSNYCSYCIVPFVRGEEKSLPLKDALKKIKKYDTKTCKEIVFLGQNILAYGRDIGEEDGLINLLLETNNMKFERIQFITSHPKDVTDNLIKDLSKIKNLCHYFHLPIQSGDNKILRLMNRGYDVEEYEEKINKIREIMPDAAITTDIITGFPGENKKEFKNTLKLIEKIKFDNIYAFKYSPRKKTSAYQLGDPVPVNEKRNRLKEILELQNCISKEINKKLVGSVQEVLIEEKKQNKVFGRSRTNKTVMLDKLDFNLGEIVKVIISEAYTFSLKGEVLNKKEDF